MRHLILLLPAILLLPTPDASGQIEPADPVASGTDMSPCDRSTDEFTGTVSIVCNHFSPQTESQPAHEITGARFLLASGKGVPMILFVSQSSSWNFIDEDLLYGLIDGSRKQWPVVEHDTEASGESISESYYVPVSTEDLREISKADTVRFRIGTAAFDLSESPIQRHASALQKKLD